MELIRIYPPKTIANIWVFEYLLHFLQFFSVIVFIIMNKDIIRNVLHQFVEEEQKKYKKPRKYSKSYCKKTPCKDMGFTQKASCRPYKNCYK